MIRTRKTDMQKLLNAKQEALQKNLNAEQLIKTRSYANEAAYNF